MTPAALFAGGLAAGLVAGTASCTAVQGGVLIALTRLGTGREPPAPSDAGNGRETPASATCDDGACPSDDAPCPSDAPGSSDDDPCPSDVSEPPSGSAIVPAFIAGRLASHALAGALLGALGGAVRIPPEARAVLLVGAGIAVIAFAIRLIRKPGPACSPRRARPRQGPPARWRPRAKAAPVKAERARAAVVRAAVVRAALVGAATILIPCGVTLSTEVVAVSSGSWLGGAAVMAGFVTGTAPAFALLGLLVRRVAGTRLAVLAGAAALVAGSVTVFAGLSLGGWLPDLGGTATATAASAPLIRADGTQVVTVWSTEGGYRPGVAAIEAGRPAEIVFRTEGNHGCTRTLTIQGHDITLPVTGQETVRLAPQRPGRLRYVCGMGMYIGFININQPPSSVTASLPTERRQHE